MKVTDEMVTAALCAKYGEGDVSDMLRGCGDEETSIMRAALTAAIALMRGQSWEVVGYMDPDADFMLPREKDCILSSQLILVRTPTERYSRPVYLPAPPKDTADEQ